MENSTTSRVIVTRRVLSVVRVVRKLSTSYYRPRSVFRVFGKRSESKFSKIGDFLRSYLSRHDAMPAWFLTLTLHYQNKSDKESNKILSYFLNYMRKKGIIRSYFWRAEVQKRGAIHWHIIFLSELNDKENLHSALWYYWQLANSGTSGYPADFIKLDLLTSGGAVYYTSKYVSKLPSLFSRPLTSRTCGISSDLQRVAKPVHVSFTNHFPDGQFQTTNFPNSVVSLSHSDNVFSNVVLSLHLDRYLYGYSESLRSRLALQPYLSGRVGMDQLRENIRYFARLEILDSLCPDRCQKI